VEPEEDPLVLVEAAAADVEELAELVEPEVAAVEPVVELEEAAELVVADLALVEELAEAEVEVDVRPLVAAGS
jgi:hypothetical protein